MMLYFSKEEACKILSKHARDRGLKLDDDVRLIFEDPDEPYETAWFVAHIICEEPLNSGENK